MDTRVRLRWNRNVEPDIKEYRIYRDGNLVPLTVVSDPGIGSTVEVQDLYLTNGREYRYRLEAVDMQGNVSGLTMEGVVVPMAGAEWGL